MSRVSIDALLAEYREAPKAMTKTAKAISSVPVYEDAEIEKMASLLSDVDTVPMGETFEEKVAQALILGETISSMEKVARQKKKNLYRE